MSAQIPGYPTSQPTPPLRPPEAIQHTGGPTMGRCDPIDSTPPRACSRPACGDPYQQPEPAQPLALLPEASPLWLPPSEKEPTHHPGYLRALASAWYAAQLLEQQQRWWRGE